jgi:hypothetical protein
MYMLLVHTWDAFQALVVTLTAIVLIAAIGTRPRRSHTAWPGRAYGVGEPAWLLRRMSIRHRIRVCCVCSMQTRTGVSVSGGYTSSVGSGVTVGLETSPGYSDQIVLPVLERCAQYAGAPAAVTPAAPSVAHLEPTATTGSTGAG